MGHHLLEEKKTDNMNIKSEIQIKVMTKYE